MRLHSEYLIKVKCFDFSWAPTSEAQVPPTGSRLDNGPYGSRVLQISTEHVWMTPHTRNGFYPDWLKKFSSDAS